MVESARKAVWLVVFLSVHVSALAAEVYAPAAELDKPDLQLMGCPRDATWDPRNGGECWSCRQGAVRSAFAIDGPKACLTSPIDDTAAARMVEQNKNTCTGSAYFDPITASCWLCPNNGSPDRLQAADGPKACFTRVAKQERKADYEYAVDSLLQSCRSGTFANVGSRKCHSCPKGWRHDPTKTVGTKGVCYKRAVTDRFAAVDQKKISLTCTTGFYDPIRGGSCWTCPSGFTRGVSAVDSADACFKAVLPEHVPAKKLSDQRFDLQQAARGALSLGCSNQDSKAFFDPKGGGSCWRCPSSHPKRSLFAVDDSRACMSTACGAEAGRPCLVWERIPSCDKGLVEDFTNNTCRRPQNLACRAYVDTLTAMRTAVETAGGLADDAQRATLERVPGKEAMMKALESTMGQLQKQAERATEDLVLTDVTKPFQDFVIENQDFMARLQTAARIAVSEGGKLRAIFADKDLMCGGDVKRMVWRLESLGFGDIFDPPKRHGIQLGSAGLASAYPFSLAAGIAGQPALYAKADADFIKPHHRMIFDLSVNLPFTHQPGVGGEVSLTGSFGLQIATNWKDSHGLYFTHGITVQGGAKSVSSMDVYQHFGGVDFAVGYQYLGQSKDECAGSGNYSWGIPLKLGNLVSIGFNTTCPYAWNGVSLTLGNVGYVKNRQTGDHATSLGAELMIPMFDTSASPSGNAPVGTGGSGSSAGVEVGTKKAAATTNSWRLRLPEPKKQIGSGFEGAITIVETDTGSRASIF